MPKLKHTDTVTFGKATSTDTVIRFQAVNLEQADQYAYQYNKSSDPLISFIGNYFPFLFIFALAALVYIAVDELIIKRFK